MTDHVFNAISKTFQEGLTELLILHLAKRCEKTNAKQLMVELGQQYGLWLTDREVYTIVKRLQKQGMFQWVMFSTDVEITIHGKEEIDDRVNQMQRFIGYLSSNCVDSTKKEKK
jgi:hypothetical protein